MKLSAKDLEMVATTIVDAIYDDNYVSKAKQKMSEKMWKEFRENKKVKELEKIFENENIDSIYVKKSFFDGTPAEKGCGYYSGEFRISGCNEIENVFRNKCENTLNITYPYRSQVFMDVKSQLVIECIGGKDLKKAIEGIQKSMKQKLDLLSRIK